jgi:hypothetical protein
VFTMQQSDDAERPCDSLLQTTNQVLDPKARIGSSFSSSSFVLEKNRRDIDDEDENEDEAGRCQFIVGSERFMS